MKRGRRPDLKVVQDLKGNPSKRDRKPGIRSSGEVVIPDHLPEDAVDCIRLIREAMPPEVYCSLDSFAMAIYAFAWSEHKAAVEALEREGFIQVTNQGVESPSPWHRIAREAAMVMAKYGPSLGLDPIARQQMANQSEGQSNRFGDLVNVRKG